MKIITHDRVARWYGLSWIADETAIRVSVHREMASVVKLEPASFADVLSYSEAGDFINLTAKLPQVFRVLDDACQECGGTGKNQNSYEGKCMYCLGLGKEHVFERDRAFAVSQSLSQLLDLVAYPEIETTCKSPQLLTVLISGDHDRSYLGGMYSIPLVRWLSSKKPPPYHLTDVENAMKTAFSHMMREGVHPHDEFRATVDFAGGWLNISCPGDRCSLHPASGSVAMGHGGYEFMCHNVDTHAQQLTFLAGLAALHDLVDGELAEK